MKLIFLKRLRRHEIEAGLTYKWEHIKEQSREYEMRDSSGYSVPHTANRLDLIYTLSSTQNIKSHRIEGYIQDVFKWNSQGEIDPDDETEPSLTYYTLNYGVRFANWSYNKETIVSPRVSLAIVPAFNNDITYRFATGLYYQAPFYKELRDTITQAGITVVKLNEKIKSQRSLQFIAAIDYRFKMNDRPFKFTAEAYYKHLSNLIPYNVQNVKVTYYGENLCSGYAAGLDLKLFGEFVPGTDLADVIADEDSAEDERHLAAHTYRPALCHQSAFHRLFPRHAAMEDDTPTGLCRRSALRCATPRHRCTELPRTGL